MFKGIKEMFGLGGKSPSIVISAPVEGSTVPITEVSDPTFGEEILGKGIAIKPARGRVVSPVNGKVAMMFETGHAVSLVSDDGVEVLVHVGLDTIKLKGEFYTIHAHDGDTVKIGDLLMEFDMDGIKEAGYDIITPIVICNTADFASVTPIVGNAVSEGDQIIEFKK